MSGRIPVAAALTTLVLLGSISAALAEEVTVLLPWGWRVDQRAVTSAGGPVAMGIHEIRAQEKARIYQFRDGKEILTDVASGWCSAIQYNPGASHLLATIALRRRGSLSGSRFYLVDAAGAIVWSSTERQSPRFSVSGESFFVVTRNEPARVTVVGLDGEPIREVILDRPFHDALVLGTGEELIVLFKKDGTAGPTLERIAPEGERKTAWKIELDARRLPPNPHLSMIDEGTILLEQRTGFLAAGLDGSHHEFLPESFGSDDPIYTVEYYEKLKPYQGPRPGTLLLAGELQTHLLDLETGKLEDTKIRLASYFKWLVRDRKMIVVRGTEVILHPLTDMEE